MFNSGKGTFSISTQKDKPFLFEDLNQLPNLMQDLMFEGSVPDDITFLIEKYANLKENPKILEFSCGKGKISIHIAKTLNLKITGIDILKNFISMAKENSAENGLDDLCSFYLKDNKEASKEYPNNDLIIYTGITKMLHDYDDSVDNIKSALAKNGHLVLHGPFVKEKISENDYFTYEDWQKLFKRKKFKIIRTILREDLQNEELSEQNKKIKNRIKYLSKLYSCGNRIFEEYLYKILSEDYSLRSDIVAATWLLRNVE